SEGSRVIVALILARLLTPGDYGVAGMAMVSVSFASLFTDPALGSALIQRRRINEEDRSTVFWPTVVIGAIAALVGVGVAGCPGGARLVPDTVAAALRLFTSQPRRPRGLRRQVVRRAHPELGQLERRQRPDRALPRRGPARRVRAGLQRHVPTDHTDLRAADE